MAVKYIWESPIFVHFKKHFCPKCGCELKVIKVNKIVNSKSEEAVNFDFYNGETFFIGNVKFIWNEFKCPKCKNQISIKNMKIFENENKRNLI